MNKDLQFKNAIEFDLSQAWDHVADALEDDPMRPVRYAKAFRYLREVAPAGKLLEVGCGQGTGLVLAKQLGFKQMVGVEVSGERLQRARDKHGPEVVLKQVGTDSRWDFADNQFDVCISCAVVEHAEDPGAFIKEIARVVRPGGYIVISSDCWQWRILQVLGIYRSVQPIDSAPFPSLLLRSFKKNGLNLIHFEGFPLPGREYCFFRMIYEHAKNISALRFLLRFACQVGRVCGVGSQNKTSPSATRPCSPQLFEEILQAPLLPYHNLTAIIHLLFSDENVFFLRKNEKNDAV